MPSRMQASINNREACSESSLSKTLAATILRLQTSTIMYRKWNVPLIGVFRYVISQLHTWFGPVATCSFGRWQLGGLEDSR
jgi:hypothetical protein